VQRLAEGSAAAGHTAGSIETPQRAGQDSEPVQAALAGFRRQQEHLPRQQQRRG